MDTNTTHTQQPPYRAVLFDLDGTLLDTLEDLATAANNVLEKRGLPTHDMDAYRYFVGSGATKLIERILPENVRNPETIDQAVAEFKKQYARIWDATSAPYPGITAMLQGLADRGIAMAVLSNKPDDFTRLCVARLLAGVPFAIVRGVLPDGPLKPDPTGAVAVSRELEVDPGRILYVGDTAIDMETARRAGMTAAGVLWGFRTRKELVEAGAHMLINRPGEILEIVDGRDIAALQSSSAPSHSA